MGAFVDTVKDLQFTLTIKGRRFFSQLPVFLKETEYLSERPMSVKLKILDSRASI